MTQDEEFDYSPIELEIRMAIVNDFYKREKPYYEENEGVLFAAAFALEEKTRYVTPNRFLREAVEDIYKPEDQMKRIAGIYMVRYNDIKGELEAGVQEMPENLQRIATDFAEGMEKQDRVIRNLVRLAETQGIKYAKKPETIRSEFQREFTKNQFRKFHQVTTRLPVLYLASEHGEKFQPVLDLLEMTDEIIHKDIIEEHVEAVMVEKPEL